MIGCGDGEDGDAETSCCGRDSTEMSQPQEWRLLATPNHSHVFQELSRHPTGGALDARSQRRESLKGAANGGHVNKTGECHRDIAAPPS